MKTFLTLRRQTEHDDFFVVDVHHSGVGSAVSWKTLATAVERRILDTAIFKDEFVSQIIVSDDGIHFRYEKRGVSKPVS